MGAEALAMRFDRPDRSKRRFASCEKPVRWALHGNGLKVRFAGEGVRSSGEELDGTSDRQV